MTPKEKAEELVDKYYVTIVSFLNDRMKNTNAKQCALIAVDEIVDAIDWHEYEVPNDQLKFWFEVTREIEKL